MNFQPTLIGDDDIRGQILGRVEAFHKLDASLFEAIISYAVEISGFELTQLLNVIYGNSSIIPGIRVERLELPDSILQAFKGPCFGRDGLRNYLHVRKRPILCTALKPMGLTPRSLADYAYQLARGGIDIIKDDHGLADQPFAPFEERVTRCAAAVARANSETGLRSIYVPNITASANQILEKVIFAKQAGAGGLMIAPGLAGFDAMRQVADDDSINLPIMSHPAFSGSYVTSPQNGISHYAFYGQLQRLAGADASIFPNFGGRFAFSLEECQSIVSGCSDPMAHLKSIFASPGGGMRLDNIPRLREVYGSKVIYLIGGDLHRHSGDLTENARRFVQLVSDNIDD